MEPHSFDDFNTWLQSIPRDSGAFYCVAEQYDWAKDPDRWHWRAAFVHDAEAFEYWKQLEQHTGNRLIAFCWAL